MPPSPLYSTLISSDARRGPYTEPVDQEADRELVVGQMNGMEIPGVPQDPFPLDGPDLRKGESLVHPVLPHHPRWLSDTSRTLSDSFRRRCPTSICMKQKGKTESFGHSDRGGTSM